MATQKPPGNPDDVYTVTQGVVTPAKAKKFKANVVMLGNIEMLLGIYMCFFGLANALVIYTYNNSVHIAQYSAMCAAGVFLAIKGAMKKWRNDSKKMTRFNAVMSLVSVAMLGALGALAIRRMIIPDVHKLGVLNGIITVVCIITAVICLAHFVYLCTAWNLSLKPKRAIMYTNERTGEQTVVEDLKKSDKARRATSFSARNPGVSTVSATPSMLHAASPKVPMSPGQARPGILKGTPVTTA